jgi:hypothetical protein
MKHIPGTHPYFWHVPAPGHTERHDVRPWPVDPAKYPLNPSYRKTGQAYVPSTEGHYHALKYGR